MITFDSISVHSLIVKCSVVQNKRIFEVNMGIHLGLALVACVIIATLHDLVQGSTMPVGPNGIGEIVRYAKSAEIRNYLNESADPCSNFYTFSCGNYYRINPPNKLPYQSNIFQTISESMNRKVSHLLRTTNDDGETETDKKVKMFFESCMQCRQLKPHYGEKLKEIIAEFGQMPVLASNDWREEDFDWLKTVGEIAYKYNIRIIVGHLNQVDISNNTVNRIHILMQNLPLESVAIYVDGVHQPIRDARQQVMIKTFRNAFGLSSKLAKQTVKEIFEFETKVLVKYSNDADADTAEASTEDTTEADDSEDTSSWVQNLTTIEEMHNKYFPLLDVKRLMNISLGYVPEDEVYDIIEDEVENMVMAISETPKRIVANYIFYYLIEAFLLPEPRIESDLETLCIRRTKTHFAKVLDNMVYRKYATNQTELDVRYMWQTIKTAFKNVLESDKLTWMKKETRQYAAEKLKTISMEINSYQNANFSQEFGPLTITNDDYIANLKGIWTLNAMKSRTKLTQPAESYDDAESLSYTPVYIITENLIKVPVAVLQPYYLWSDYYPNALKFGTLGFLMSHELIHGFDDEGRTHDKWGNKHEWWDSDSNAYFSNQTECFNEQYTKFIYVGRTLPELDSQSENIADNGGIRLAYNAYLRWYEDAVRSYRNDKAFESMPRLNYNHKQLFFISYGQLWCSALHPALRYFVSSTDDHVPEKFRVLGPLKNLEEFSKVFQCPVGSEMNPSKKCIIY